MWGEIVGRCWVQSFKKPLYPRKRLTNGIPDAKQGPGPRGCLHHQVNIHEDADQWEDRKSRDLWAESVHHWTQPRCLKERSNPMWVGDSCPPQAVHSVPTEIVYAKPWVWIREESIGFSNSPHSLSSKQYLPSQDIDFVHSRWTLWAHKFTYSEWKRRGVLGLPPDDDRDPSDEQQQQHSHCCEHGVSREHLAGPLGQDQAQDGQQENCKCQGGEEQPGLQKTKTLGPQATPFPVTTNIRNGHHIFQTPPLTK